MANRKQLAEKILRELYVDKSMQEMADLLHCSLHKIAYWMGKYNIPIRSRSETMYKKHNPGGDPFVFVAPKNLEEAKLFGLGLGLYWGEGTKANLNSIRLGNTDPKLIKKFSEFLVKFFGIDKNDLRFGLQIFSDLDANAALDFWLAALKIRKAQVGKVIVTKSGSLGTYRKKSPYGVMTVMYHNVKLRKLLGAMLPM